MTVPALDTPCAMVHTPIYDTKKNDTFTIGASHMVFKIQQEFNHDHQAPHVKPVDYADFIGYSMTWYKFVKGHHDSEESELFPKVEEVLGKEGIWDGTHVEHESFLAGLASFEKYLFGLRSSSDFSGDKLITIMDSFLKPFNDHFHSEITTIASFSKLGDFPDAGLVFKIWGKESIMKAGYTDVVPFLFLNFDRTFEDGMWKDWPPMPKVIRMGLTRVGSSWHWGWWKFASCDVDGMPKALHATG